jgi:hypothetical protein
VEPFAGIKTAKVTRIERLHRKGAQGGTDPRSLRSVSRSLSGLGWIGRPKGRIANPVNPRKNVINIEVG